MNKRTPDAEPFMPIITQRAERDGCDCPPWVLRCAHVGDQVIRVIQTDLFPFSSWDEHLVPSCRYSIIGPAALRMCSCGNHDVLNWTQKRDPFETNDLAEAEAEFTRREAQLLESVPCP